MKVLMGEHHPWNSDLKVGSHYFAEMFMKEGYKIAWLSRGFHPLKYFSHKHRFWSEYKMWSKRVIQNNNLWECKPLFLFPYRNYPPFNNLFFNRNCHRFSIPNIVSILKKNNRLNVDILWITNILDYRWTLEEVNYRVSVYRAADLASGFPASPSTIEKVEEEIVRKVDIVITPSRIVYDKLKSIKGDNVYYIPNGVDLERFKMKYPEPREYRSLKDDIAIYVGAINEWVDFDIISEIARSIPQLEIVLIGKANFSNKKVREKVRECINKLKNYENIHILGPRNPKIVPAYLQYASVGIIPFKKNILTEATHPLKLYEYLAAGLPTVSFGLQETLNTGLPMFIAKGKEDFAENIREALNISPDERKKLKEIVKDHTWEKRFELIKNILRMSEQMVYI